jgi:hypothetical protein
MVLESGIPVVMVPLEVRFPQVLLLLSCCNVVASPPPQVTHTALATADILAKIEALHVR